MLWTERDDETIRQCRRCIENCKHYHTLPAAWFPLCIKMYEALRDAGLLEKQELEAGCCEGCVFAVGGCHKAYAEAALDESRKRVIYCKQKTTKKQKAALERAAKGKKETRPAHSLAACRSRI